MGIQAKNEQQREVFFPVELRILLNHGPYIAFSHLLFYISVFCLALLSFASFRVQFLRQKCDIARLKKKKITEKYSDNKIKIGFYQNCLLYFS